MRLWVEHAHSVSPADGDGMRGDAVRTFQTEEQFFAVLASSYPDQGQHGADETQVTDRVAALLEQGASAESALRAVLAALPDAAHVSLSILQARSDDGRAAEGACQLSAFWADCDAPPFLMVRQGGPVQLPAIEEIASGRLLRQRSFSLLDGDYLAMVGAGYVQAMGRGLRWSWRDIAMSAKRLTDTGCDAEQLVGALIRLRARFGPDGSENSSALAMHVRPLRTATIWTGPPDDRSQDGVAWGKLMAETGMRVICGDTTGAIAARLAGAQLELEPRPEDGWAEVPPVSRLAGVDLVTEGVVTLLKAHERLANAQRVRDLPRGQDGATRLARALLAADRIHVILGQVVNPVQAAGSLGTLPSRREIVASLLADLRARGKLVSVEYV